MIRRYMRWLHTGWPAGTLEKLPLVREDGTTAIPGIRVVGDLTGIPLLKFAADQHLIPSPPTPRGCASRSRGTHPAPG